MEQQPRLGRAPVEAQTTHGRAHRGHSLLGLVLEVAHGHRLGAGATHSPPAAVEAEALKSW